jgi:hypothetical protein
MIEPLHIVLWSLLVGATSAGMTVAIRALPLVKKWIEQMKKPWACDVCMSFWTVGLLALGLGFWRGWENVLVCGPAYPWALWVLCKVTEHRSELVIGELEDSE